MIEKKDYFCLADAKRQYALSVAVYMFFSLFVSTLLLALGISELDSTMYASALLSVALGLSAFVYSRCAKTDFFVATKLNKLPKPKETLFCIAITVLLIFVSMPVSDLFFRLIEGMGLDTPTVDISISKENFVFALVTVCILPAVNEEIVFRGVILNGLYSFKSKKSSVIISGLLFALFHMNPAQTVHQFALGVLLGIFVLNGGSLYVSILAHFCNNFFVVFVEAFGIDVSFAEENPYLCGAIALALVVALLFVYFKTTPKKEQVKTEQQYYPADNTLVIVAVVVSVVVWLTTLLLS